MIKPIPCAYAIKRETSFFEKKLNYSGTQDEFPVRLWPRGKAYFKGRPQETVVTGLPVRTRGFLDGWDGIQFAYLAAHFEFLKYYNFKKTLDAEFLGGWKRSMLISDLVSKQFDRVILGSMLTLLAALTFSTALVEISFAIALTCWIFKNFGRRTFLASLKPVPGKAILIGYVALVILTAFWSENYALSFRGILKVLQQCAILVLAYDTFKSKNNLKILTLFVPCLVAVVSLNGLVQYYFGKDLIRGFTTGLASSGLRVSGSFKSYGLLAAFLMMVLPLCVGIYCYYRDLNSNKWAAVLCIFSVIAGLYVLYLTRSRGAALAFVVGTVILMVAARKFKLLALLCLMGVGGLMLIPKGMIIHLDINGKEQSLVERYYLWDRALAVIKAKPINGTGINTYAESHMAYDQTGSWRVKRYYAHNGYLQLAAETGLPSLLIYLAFIGLIISSGIRFFENAGERKRYQLLVMGFTGSCLNFCLLAVVDTVMHNSVPVMSFWYFSGCLWAVIAHARIPEKSKLSKDAAVFKPRLSEKARLFSQSSP